MKNKMGEYVKYKNDSIKLGTCEDLYYCTYKQLVKEVSSMEQASGNSRPSEYLKETNGFRYRFPFPDEENVSMGEFADFDRGYPVELPRYSKIFNDMKDLKSTRVEIVQQKLVENQLWVVVRHEGDKGRLNYTLALELVEALKEQGTLDDLKMASQVLQGYCNHLTVN